MLTNPAWPLAVALQQVALGRDERTAVSAVMQRAHGSVRTLEAAYGRALALVNELPKDERARRVVTLLSKALGQAVSR